MSVTKHTQNTVVFPSAVEMARAELQPLMMLTADYVGGLLRDLRPVYVGVMQACPDKFAQQTQGDTQTSYLRDGMLLSSETSLGLSHIEVRDTFAPKRLFQHGGVAQTVLRAQVVHIEEETGLHHELERMYWDTMGDICVPRVNSRSELLTDIPGSLEPAYRSAVSLTSDAVSIYASRIVASHVLASTFNDIAAQRHGVQLLPSADGKTLFNAWATCNRDAAAYGLEGVQQYGLMRNPQNPWAIAMPQV